MTTPATPASTPTAPTSSPASSAPSTSAPKSSPSSSSQTSSAPMSTADFRRTMLNKKSNTADFNAPEQTVDTSDNSDDVLSSSYDTSDDNDAFAQQDAEEQIEDAEQPELSDELEAPDYSWAEPLSAYRDGVHGVATAELLQALQNGELPEALFDKLTLTMKDGDEEWTGNISDLRNGAQMHANFTRSKQALAAERKAYESERNELVEHFRSWKADETGETGLAGLEKMLGETAVYKIAERLAQRIQRKEQLEALEASGQVPPGTAQALMEREQLQRELQDAKVFKQRHDQQTEQEQVSQHAQQVGQKVNAEAVRQFKQAGIEGADLTEGMWNLFKEEMLILWQDANKTPTPAEIRMAVMAAKQRSDRHVAKHLAQQQAAAQKAAAGRTGVVTGASTQAAPAAPKKSAGGGRQKAMSTAEFKAKMMGGKR